MSSSKIRPTTVLAEVGAILMRLAAKVESGDDSASEKALAELCPQWLERHEALVAVAMVTEERQRCAECGRAASKYRLAGEICSWCAVKQQRINEANQQE